MIHSLPFPPDLVLPLLSGRKTRTRLVVPLSHLTAALSETRYRPKWRAADLIWVREPWQQEAGGPVCFAADYVRTHSGTPPGSAPGWRWRSAASLPQAYARIWLTVELVRFERLRSITKAEAKREGFTSIGAFLQRFTELHPRLEGADPVVYVIGFRLIERMQQAQLPGVW